VPVPRGRAWDDLAFVVEVVVVGDIDVVIAREQLGDQLGGLPGQRDRKRHHPLPPVHWPTLNDRSYRDNRWDPEKVLGFPHRRHPENALRAAY
jgi:hypothetical protein